MGFWSWLTGGGKVVDTACDLAKDLSSGIDMLVYTDEEKAQARQKGFDSWLRILEVEKDASGARAVTRRIIAVSITFQWLFMINVGLGFLLVGDTDRATIVFGVLGTVTAAVSFILGFYFGPQQISAAFAAYRAKTQKGDQ